MTFAQVLMLIGLHVAGWVTSAIQDRVSYTVDGRLVSVVLALIATAIAAALAASGVNLFIDVIEPTDAGDLFLAFVMTLSGAATSYSFQKKHED